MKVKAFMFIIWPYAKKKKYEQNTNQLCGTEEQTISCLRKLGGMTNFLLQENV